MFNEIYNGFIEILKKGPEEEVEYMKKDKGRIPHLLSLSYDFDPLKIVRVKTIKFVNSPNIILVLASSPKGNPNTKYAEYLVVDGKLSKVILLNIDALMQDTDTDKFSREAAFSIASSVCYAVDTIVHYYFKGLNDDDKGDVELMGRFVKLMYYSTPILIVKLLDRLYDGKINKIEMAGLLGVVLNNTDRITMSTVDSIRELLAGTSLYDLLDNSLLLLASEDAYPGLFYADVDDGLKEDEDNDEDKTV